MTPKTDALRADLIKAKFNRWGYFADLQYREFYKITQRVPTAQEYMTTVLARGMFR